MATSTLRSYQFEGVKFLAARDAAILGDEPGLGKSAQAILAAEEIRARRILIVCPAIGHSSWPIELKKWDMSERDIVHVGGRPKTGSSSTNTNPAGAVHIVSYDLLSRGGPLAKNIALMAKAGVYDLLILDEGQYLKDSSSKRTKLVYDYIAPHIPVTFVLSGSITPNNNSELYPHLKALFPDTLKSLFVNKASLPTRTEFEDAFCRVRMTTYGGPLVRVIIGNKDTVRLRDAMQPHILRRHFTDVLKQLPPLTVSNHEFTDEDLDLLLSPSQRAALDAARGLFDEQFVAKEVVHNFSNKISRLFEDYTNHAEGILHLGEGLTPDPAGSPNQNASAARRQLGLAKVPLVGAWAEEQLLSGQDKIILFAVHKDVVAALQARLADYNPLAITGSTSSQDRTERVRLFQEDPGHRVIIGNVQAMGTAITLTASNIVGLAEPSWVPGDNIQAIGRAYRFGQARPVFATFLSVQNSLDSAVTRVLARKARGITDLLDDDMKANTARMDAGGSPTTKRK
jgi:SWI/SNF-related matrix-associated actin-dependent regulator of chromatin subfamily A-like protein 1